jgi:hypothetical protein
VDAVSSGRREDAMDVNLVWRVERPGLWAEVPPISPWFGSRTLSTINAHGK